MGPQRIQLSRAKGWRMPPNSVSVARPGRWGNPHAVSRFVDAATCVELFRDSVQGCWSPSTSAHLPDAWAIGAYRDHHAWLHRIGGHPLECVRAELGGKNLACWCKLPAPGEPDICHAAVLLELANPTPGPTTRGDG